ncbi:MAG: serine hydrolase domain-containing protein [Verrucomicrobiota bacterium]
MLWAADPVDKALLDRLRQTDALFWSPEDRRLGLSLLEKIKPTREIKSARDRELNVKPHNFSDFVYEFEGQSFSLKNHLDSQQVAGLMILRAGQVVYEHYADSFHQGTRWNGFSIAKSALALLVGLTIQTGQIESIDTSVSVYLPELEASAYSDVTIRNLMHMSSGVAWSEDYADPESDVARLSEFTAGQGILGLIEYMAKLPTKGPPGSIYNYNTGEIYLLGFILSRVTGQSLSELMSQRLWNEIGANESAHWMLNAPGGLETAGCCIAATLEAHAKLGQFVLEMASDLKGDQILSSEWLEFMRAPSPQNERYGALWFRDGPEAIFAAGIFGQLIYIDFSSETVIAIHSHWNDALSEGYLSRRNAFVRAISEVGSF